MSAILGGVAKRGDVISFEVIPVAVLGNDFNRMRLEGIVNAQIAESMGLSPYTKHHQVYPLLPSGSVPNNPDQYDFAILETLTGQKLAVGVPWINMNTLKVVKSNMVTIKCINVPSEKLPVIREALSANGISVMSIDIT